jgi:hypothetical protein
MGAVRRFSGTFAILLSTLLTLCGCAGSSWNGRVYEGDRLAFRLGPIPPTWRQIDSESVLLAFRDASRDLLVSINGRCGRDEDDVPLQALTQQLFIYFTQRQIVTQTPLMLDGREALRTELSAQLDGVVRRFVTYVLKKDGCVYDFVLIAAPTLDVRARAEFDRFVDGFSTNTRT